MCVRYVESAIVQRQIFWAAVTAGETCEVVEAAGVPELPAADD